LNPGRNQRFSLLQKPSILFLRPTQPSLHWVLGVQWLGHEVDHSPAPDAEVKNEWSYTTALPVYPYDVDRYSFTIKEAGLEVGVGNTKYVFIFCQQTAGQNCDIQIANEIFENAASSNA
jgi:hypothetical protein